MTVPDQTCTNLLWSRDTPVIAGGHAGAGPIDAPLQLIRLALALIEEEGAASSIQACHLQAAIDSRVPPPMLD